MYRIKPISLPDDIVFDDECLQIAFSTVVVKHILPHIVSSPDLLYLKYTEYSAYNASVLHLDNSYIVYKFRALKTTMKIENITHLELFHVPI